MGQASRQKRRAKHEQGRGWIVLEGFGFVLPAQHDLRDVAEFSGGQLVRGERAVHLFWRCIADAKRRSVASDEQTTGIDEAFRHPRRTSRSHLPEGCLFDRML